MTKKECLTYVKDNLLANVADVETRDTLNEWVDKELAALDKKAASAKVYAKRKREESDALCDAVFAVLTDEFQTIEAITNLVGNEDVTKAKVQARLTKLFKAGAIDKASVNTAADGEKKRMVVAYALLPNCPVCE